jgi:hypothetical protein
MGFLMTFQDDVHVMPKVLKATADTNATLVGEAAQHSQAYRLASLAARTHRLKETANGVYVSLKGTTDGDTGTFEIWGYPKSGGAAQFFGAYTWTIDECADDDGLLYVDEFVESVAGQHSVTILNFADGRACLKFDTLGLTHFVYHVTAITSTDAIIEIRSW